MVKVKLAKACHRREKGAPMMVSERAAYKLMARGDAVVDKKFMNEYEKKRGKK